MRQITIRNWLKIRSRVLWLSTAALSYLLLASYQLGLPGLHYDEAKEAGINAMELVGGIPVTAFRGATVDLFGIELPLMVQDYIGSLNVFLAMPFLAITGVGVPNLRIAPLLIGLAVLLLTERTASEWLYFCNSESSESEMNSREVTVSRVSISLAGIVAAWLLAVSPTFLFWSRQGIFVTNLMQVLCLLCVWQAIRWMRTHRSAALIWAAASAGLALYAKLLSLWIVAPLALIALAWWLVGKLTGRYDVPKLSIGLVAASVGVFVIPLVPLILFNVQTGGTFIQLFDNLGNSYYGIDNRSIFANLSVRMEQVVDVLHGGHLWYLGGSYRNALAPWLAVGSVAAGFWRSPRCTFWPFFLIAAAVLISVVTISDLFVTHYALLYPFMIAAAAISLDRLWHRTARASLSTSLVRGTAVFLLALWIGGNLIVTVRYHQALHESGGLADHSDASYHLAYYLRYNGLGAPIALDWGIEAPVRYLTQDAVRPIEIFGYGSLDEADARYRETLLQFLPNTDNVYLLHSPGFTVFKGRREAFLETVAENNLVPRMEQSFGQRDGQSLFEVWRVYAVTE